MGKTGREAMKRGKQRPIAEGNRTLRLQQLIQEEVNFLLRADVRDVRLAGVMVTYVELAGDASCARLWFTADGDRTIVSSALERASGYLRTQLAESLGLKRTPELRWKHDPTSRIAMPWLEH